LKSEGDSFYADSTVLDELYPEMIPYGKVGILTELASPGDSIPFLPAGTHQVFTNPSNFLAADLDTRVIIYPVDRDLGLSPSRFGYQLEPGDVVAFTDNQGVKTVLIRERFSERMEWFFLSYEVLGLEGTYTRDDITRLFQYGGDLYRGTLFSNNRSRFVPRDVAFTGELSNQRDVVSPIELCQIEQTNRQGSMYVDTNANFGFPIGSIVPPIGEVNVAIIAVEFPDVPGEEEYLPIYLSQVEIMEEWAQFVSGGAMTYNVVFPDRWIMAPREARYYTRLGGTQMALDRPDAIAGQPFEDSVQQLVTASDPYLDWSTIDFVQFVFPIESAKYAVDFQGYARNLYSPRSGSFDLFAWGAAYEKFRPDYPDPKHRTLWDWVVHEVLHPQGLVGHGPLNGSVFSIMMDQHGETKALLSWESFLMGHFDEQHIACINPSEIKEPVHLQMESLDQTGGAPGLKSIMLPVSDSEIIVLEYRTEGPFSTLSPEFRGFTAYYIDVDGQYLRCDWCDPIIMEYQTYTRYIRNPNETLVCDQGFAPTTICNFPSIVQYPGMHLDVFGLRLEFFNDGVVGVSRLY
jgi:hypothetical protein